MSAARTLAGRRHKPRRPSHRMRMRKTHTGGQGEAIADLYDDRFVAIPPPRFLRSTTSSTTSLTNSVSALRSPGRRSWGRVAALRKYGSLIRIGVQDENSCVAFGPSWPGLRVVGGGGGRLAAVARAGAQ